MIKKIKWGGNVHIFDGEKSETIEVKNENNDVIAIVAGVGYFPEQTDENIIKKYPVIFEEVPVVGIFHAYDAINYDAFRNKSYDYWALGHIHKRSIVDGDTKPIVFPGCISGRDWSETGEKGAYLVTLEKRANPKCEFVSLSNIKWQEMDIDGLEDAMDAGGIVDVCLENLSNLDNGFTNFVRLNLKGGCSLYNEIRPDDINSMEEELENKTGYKVTTRNQLTSLLNPLDYKGDRHLLSMALDMTNQLKGDANLKEVILNEIKEDYKALEGYVDDDYINKLLGNMEQILCDTMIKEKV